MLFKTVHLPCQNAPVNFVTMDYALFLAIVFALATIRGGVIVVLAAAGVVFYAWWNPWLLFLILGCTLNSYLGGLAVEKRRSPALLAVFVTIDVSILFLFKYYGWFTHVTAATFRLAGLPVSLPRLALILPIGISFHIFESIGYMVDVYRRSIPAERSFIHLWLFLMFFPKLIAGPIERAPNLIPQLRALREGWLSRADVPGGLFTIFKGVALKIVVADNLALYVNRVYGDLAGSSPWDVVLACYFFSVQIYCDFYGYSLIALGTAALFGIRLTNNFDHPYLAHNIQDFWRRWHISLSNWFRDYVYIPLGGNQVSAARNAANLVLLMLLVGLWHGANHTFVIWGAAHGALLALHRAYRRLVGPERSAGRMRAVRRALGTLLTFHCVTLAWVLFRSPDLATAGIVFARIRTALLGESGGLGTALPLLVFYVAIVCLFVLFETLDHAVDLRQRFVAAPGPIQAMAFFLLLVATYLGPPENVQFIYFQF
jgi:D-alanyl-lipoteichoic acid acyltransferase DltB (MBOAT superfamily)